MLSLGRQIRECGRIVERDVGCVRRDLAEQLAKVALSARIGRIGRTNSKRGTSQFIAGGECGSPRDARATASI